MNEKYRLEASGDRNCGWRQSCGLIAIETSGRVGSVLLELPGAPPHLIDLPASERTAVSLAGAIAECLEIGRRRAEPIGLVAVASGPGSFTGLRIGVTTAKALAYGLGCRLIGVDTLATLAGGVWRADTRCTAATVAINAYRGQLFVAHWRRDEWEAAADADTLARRSQVWSVAKWTASLTRWRTGVDGQESSNIADRHSVFAAEPAVVKLTASAAGHQPITLSPHAIDVAVLARRIAGGDSDVSPMRLLPNYLRESAAEEKLE